MNKFLIIALSGAALSVLSVPAVGQNSATDTSTATTTIVQPISIANNSVLAFGQVVKPASAGANIVTIDAANGARTISGGGAGVLAAGTSSRATYTATGEGAQTFSINAPSFDMTSGGNTLTVTTAASAADGLLSGSIGSTGTATFGVGGSFSLSNSTPSGLYSGNLVVTTAYN